MDGMWQGYFSDLFLAIDLRRRMITYELAVEGRWDRIKYVARSYVASVHRAPVLLQWRDDGSRYAPVMLGASGRHGRQ
jgi:hypothetical protein